MLLERPKVWHHGVFRKAKGFSWAEIEKSEAYPGGIVSAIVVDNRRKTCIDVNVAELRSMMGHGMIKKEAKK